MREFSTKITAVYLGVTERHVRGLLRRERLPGYRHRGRWHVRSVDMVEFRAAPRRREGRPLNPETAWGIVFLLAGGDAPWLQPWTRSRCRRHLHEWSPGELVRAVADRLDDDPPVDIDVQVVRVLQAIRHAASPRFDERRAGHLHLKAILHAWRGWAH